MKRAQGLPLNAVIIAVIGIVVLAILIAVVTGFFSSDDGLKGTVSNQCLKAGGECAPAVTNSGGESDCPEDMNRVFSKDEKPSTYGCSSGQICCRASFFP